MSGWECFDDANDSDSEISNDGDNVETSALPADAELLIFVEILKEVGSPRREKQFGSLGPVDVHLSARVCLLADSTLEGRFHSANYEVIARNDAGLQSCDCVVSLTRIEESESCHKLLRPGGLLVTLVESPSPASTMPADADNPPDSSLAAEFATAVVDPRLFSVEGSRVVPLTPPSSLLFVRRRRVSINEEGVSWKPRSSRLLAAERSLVQDLTVCRPTASIHAGTLGESEVEACVRALQVHGVCVVPQLFSPASVQAWGGVALEDLKEAVAILHAAEFGAEGDGNPSLTSRTGTGGGSETTVEVCLLAQKVLRGEDGLGARNYRELAMRESLRVDLRHGPRMIRQGTEVAARSHRESLSTTPPETTTDAVPSPQARMMNPKHSGLMEVLQRLMNPHPTPAPSSVGTGHHPVKASSQKSRPHSHGNFGRWNFDGGSPTHQVPLKVGAVGAVVSLPGCTDQALHADIYHLYEHAHVPPHYVNVFLPATQDHEGSSATGSLCLGQTAFVVGSHVMAECARLTMDEHESDVGGGVADAAGGGESEERARERKESSRRARMAKLVRPHLSVGDVVLFDCRVLHFGLANRASTKSSPKSTTSVGGGDEAARTWRPTLYVNVTQRWFEDEKNWESTTLFPGEDSTEQLLAAGEPPHPQRPSLTAP